MKYADQLTEAKHRLLELEKQKASIEAQMRGWAQIISGLELLEHGTELEHLPLQIEADQLDSIGFTDSIRAAFRKHPDGLTPTEIRDVLTAAGISGSTHKTFLISIHTAIRRLVEKGEVEESKRSDGLKVYKWVSGLKRALLGAGTSAFYGEYPPVGPKGKLKDMK